MERTDGADKGKNVLPGKCDTIENAIALQGINGENVQILSFQDVLTWPATVR